MVVCWCRPGVVLVSDRGGHRRRGQARTDGNGRRELERVGGSESGRESYASSTFCLAGRAAAAGSGQHLRVAKAKHRRAYPLSQCGFQPLTAGVCTSSPGGSREQGAGGGGKPRGGFADTTPMKEGGTEPGTGSWHAQGGQGGQGKGRRSCVAAARLQPCAGLGWAGPFGLDDSGQRAAASRCRCPACQHARDIVCCILYVIAFPIPPAAWQQRGQFSAPRRSGFGRNEFCLGRQSFPLLSSTNQDFSLLLVEGHSTSHATGDHQLGHRQCDHPSRSPEGQPERKSKQPCTLSF